MFQFLRGIVLIAAMMLNGGVAFAEEKDFSANAFMPKCRGFTNDRLTAANNNWNSGYAMGECIGLIEGLNATIGCEPPKATVTQIVLVVLKYIDARPARLNEDFRLLAAEALVAAWPCKK
jgi:hypothetical protein